MDTYIAAQNLILTRGYNFSFNKKEKNIRSTPPKTDSSPVGDCTKLYHRRHFPLNSDMARNMRSDGGVWWFHTSSGIPPVIIVVGDLVMSHHSGMLELGHP